MKDTMTLVQVKFPKKLLGSIDSYVKDKQTAKDYLIDQKATHLINEGKTYTRSDFIRIACAEKLEFLELKGEALVEAVLKMAPKLFNENKFQSFLMGIVGMALLRKSKKKDFDIEKAFPGLDIDLLIKQFDKTLKKKSKKLKE